MNTFKTAAAAVLGARHARVARNGQDAVAVWVGAGASAAVVIVCDGCSSGASSEVGARLGASLFARAVGRRISAGASVADAATWDAARREVVAIFADLFERMHGDRLATIRDSFLFTIVAAAMTPNAAAVWALGDGVYSFGDDTRELGPFADNEPPYLAYDLLGDAHSAHFETREADTIIIGTDGAIAISGGIERFATSRFLDHPDALRRELAVLARPHEHIDWDERRVIRTPAVLQDDCAIAVLRREAP
ncbi:MAG TPA: protein phosphatase 2C domain-containing protein [Kofleriaceae bacterium]|nr:protein phosphatase 2C domain-containing protein [Kofleriaceae bacterium]